MATGATVQYDTALKSSVAYNSNLDLSFYFRCLEWVDFDAAAPGNALKRKRSLLPLVKEGGKEKN